MKLKEYLSGLFANLSKNLDYLNQANFGDLSTNVALSVAKGLKRNPREVAQEIIDNIVMDKNILERIEIAGPGFINFFFNPEYLAQIIKIIHAQENEYGKSKKYLGVRANVEFISANPTGPLTVGHGRNAVVGDTVANLLEAVGYEVLF